MVENLSDLVFDSCQINKDLYDQYNVKRGLRNSDGSGVLVGLTNVGDVVGYRKEDDKVIPVEGQLFYRGVEIRDLVHGFQKAGIHGFDETVYLLLTGKLPGRQVLTEFSDYLAELRDLPQYFSKSMMLSLRGPDVMNMLARSVLSLYVEDPKAEDYSLPNIIDQSLNLIAKFPVITAYSYFGMRHSYERKSLIIRHPQSDLSTAENFLYLLKGHEYTPLEAAVLDLCLVLHAEHGGGNNSSFTTRVVSSSQTDTYSAISAAIGSLKGRLHGGANLKVLEMMKNIKKNVKHWDDEKEVAQYLLKILKGDAFDGSGKIYGIGHAIYTKSDPRAILLKEQARMLAEEKDMLDEYNLYLTIERLAPEVFETFKGASAKTISANVDFYSGFVYSCIKIPKELFTPIFAVARIAGWCAHRIEEVTFQSRRIIRPAYKNVYLRQQYIDFSQRE
jgi:citrate synthase